MIEEMVLYQPDCLVTRNSIGDASWNYAARVGSKSVFEWLLQLPQIQQEVQDKSNDATVVIAMMNHYDALAKGAVENHGFLPWVLDSKQNSVLHYIYGNSDMDYFYPLVKSHVDINGQNLNNETPLMKACERGLHTIVSALLENGADVNISQKDTCRTALTIAAEHGYELVVQELLKYKANPNILFVPSVRTCNMPWMYPIIAAASLSKLAMIKLLIEHGADINVSTLDGKSAISCAATVEVRQLLQENNVHWNIPAREAQHVVRDLLKNDLQLDMLIAWMDQGIPVNPVKLKTKNTSANMMHFLNKSLKTVIITDYCSKKKMEPIFVYSFDNLMKIIRFRNFAAVELAIDKQQQYGIMNAATWNDILQQTIFCVGVTMNYFVSRITHQLYNCLYHTDVGFLFAK